MGIKQQKYGLFIDTIEEHDSIGNIASAPFKIAVKAYRALGKKAKKEKDFDRARKCFQTINAFGLATDNDKNILALL